MITVTETTPDRLGSIESEWNGLLSVSGCISPMLTWEWMNTWWECYRDHAGGRRLKLLLAHSDDGSLAGIAPFVIREMRQYGLATTRIEFMGTGEPEVDETCSEFLDVISRPALSAQVAAALAEYLRADQSWDEILLKDARADRESGVCLMHETLSHHPGMISDRHDAGECPWIRLPGTWEAYLAGISGKWARHVEYKRRRLGKEAAAELSYASTADEMKTAYRSFVELHQKLWTSRGKPGCFASPVFSSFLEQVTERLAAGDKVRVLRLEINGETAAVYHLLVLGKRLYYYNSGVDVERHGRFSPGIICFAHIIEQAIRDGFEEFHFLKGSLDSYKGHWTDDVIPLATYRIMRKGVRNSVLRTVSAARRMVSEARNK